MNNGLLRQRARANLQGNWGLSILTAIVAGIFGGLLTSTNITIKIDEELLYKLPDLLIQLLRLWTSASGMLALAAFILGGTVQLGYCRFLLNQHDGKPADFSDLFSRFENIGTGFAQMFLRTLYVILWALLLVIPGIVKAYSYSMTPLILAEYPDLTAGQAITLSRKMMDGHKMELFLLDLSFIGWMLLGLLCCGVGLLWVTPYQATAHANFYENLRAIYEPEDTIPHTEGDAAEAQNDAPEYFDVNEQ
jgi:uncharacterized membrane protein